MARDGIEYDKVVEVCEKLKVAGVKPTQRNVRAELGTGSMTTILSHINEWKEQQSFSSNSELELPAATISSIKKAMNDAVETSTQQLQAELSDTKNQVKENIELLFSMETNIEDLEKENQKQIDLAEARELELEKSLAASKNQIEELQAQNKALNEKLEISVTGQELARTETAKAQMQLERSDKAYDKAEKQIDDLTKEVNDLKGSIVIAEKEASSATSVSTEQTKTIDRLDASILESKQALELISSRYDALLEKYEESAKYEPLAKEQERSIKRFEKEQDKLLTELNALQKRHDQLIIDHQNLAKSESAIKTKLELLEK